VFKPQILNVDPNIANLDEQPGQLSGSVIHHHDKLAETAILTVLTWKPRNADIARSESFSDRTLRTGP
jgi:hypothetical protein